MGLRRAWNIWVRVVFFSFICVYFTQSKFLFALAVAVSLSLSHSVLTTYAVRNAVCARFIIVQFKFNDFISSINLQPKLKQENCKNKTNFVYASWLSFITKWLILYELLLCEAKLLLKSQFFFLQKMLNKFSFSTFEFSSLEMLLRAIRNRLCI